MYNQISMVFIFKLSIFGKQGRKEEVKKKNMTEKNVAEGIINQAPNIVFES